MADTKAICRQEVLSSGKVRQSNETVVLANKETYYRQEVWLSGKTKRNSDKSVLIPDAETNYRQEVGRQEKVRDKQLRQRCYHTTEKKLHTGMHVVSFLQKAVK